MLLSLCRDQTRNGRNALTNWFAEFRGSGHSFAAQHLVLWARNSRSPRLSLMTAHGAQVVFRLDDQVLSAVQQSPFPVLPISFPDRRIPFPANILTGKYLVTRCKYSRKSCNNHPNRSESTQYCGLSLYFTCLLGNSGQDRFAQDRAHHHFSVFA